MKYPYTQSGFGGRLRQLALAAALVTGATTAAQAQFFTAGNVTNTNPTGSFPDLGTAGTAIATANFDDANSAATPIGFSFSYAGTTFTDFVLNTNGFLKLGTTAPAAPYFSAFAQEPSNGGPLNSTTENYLLLPFNTDLEAGTGATEYRVATTGTAPNRVCTIQWKNVSDKTRTANSTSASNIDKQYANFSFQVKLFETSNNVSFVYGTATPSANPTNASFMVVGVKGSSPAPAQVVTATKASNTSWSNTTFQQGPYAAGSNAHNIRNTPTVAGATPLPDPGRSYNFALPVPIDAAVQIVYGYDKLAVPAGQPVVIRANVRNAGTAALNNLAVTLNVTGANTASTSTTVSSLAPGASLVVDFPPVAMPAVGNNTVTASTAVAGDANTSNDSYSIPMVTNPTTTGFITAGQPPINAFGFPAGAMDNYFGAKVTLVQPRTISAVNAFLYSEPNAVGSSAYGVVIDATSGALLGRSPNFVITTASLNQLHSFALSTPAAVPAGDVIVGLATVAAAGAPQFFLMGVQTENPTRPGTFFSGSATTAAAPTPALNTPGTAVFKYMLEAVTVTPATCNLPSAVSVTGTANSATVAFTGQPNGIGYQIVYGATGFNPATAGTTTATFTGTSSTVSGLTASTCYDFYVRTVCSATDQSALAGPFNFCTSCTPPTISAFPYAQNFDQIAPGQTLPCGIRVLDSNNDGFTWQARPTVDPSLATGNISRSNPNAMVYSYNNVGPTPTVGADDWFFTPRLSLVANTRYRVAFYYRSAGQGLSERLEVKYGPNANPAGQTSTIYTNNNITGTTYLPANNTTTPVVADIVATGNYFVGFHAISTANQGFLAVDDLTITAGPLATSEALKRAVSVFPNPSNTGQFNLEIHGANASSLGVEVTNMLGQRVYTGTAKDNLRTTVDLSTVASGIYTLKVRNGQEFTQQQISIVK